MQNKQKMCSIITLLLGKTKQNLSHKNLKNLSCFKASSRLFSFLLLALPSFIYVLKINKPRSKYPEQTKQPQQQNYLGSTTQKFLAGDFYTMADFFYCCLKNKGTLQWMKFPRTLKFIKLPDRPYGLFLVHGLLKVTLQRSLFLLETEVSSIPNQSSSFCKTCSP